MIIWRGDQDSAGNRKLRVSIPPCDGLFSNMINGGNPFALTQMGFINSIQHHVALGWNTTHFLSFSKLRSRAEVFAIGHSKKKLVPCGSTGWHAVLLGMNLGRMIHISSVAVGIDHYTFNEITPNHNLFQQNLYDAIALQFAIQSRRSSGIPTTRNILAIDVYSHLLHLKNNGILINPMALANSKQDEEILILPIDPLWGQLGNTALIDMGGLSKIEFFNLI